MIRRLEVEYRESASFDLAAIFRHIAEASGSADIALKFVLRLEDRCQNIGNAPRGGRPARRHRARIANSSVRAFRHHRLPCRSRSRPYCEHLLRRPRL
ncbi:type II toxin-antitoxin system RelE/ParE family toxin [Mesorhizobium ventifaucium]|uniref:type II toxin-antitoxin system RelE/ParE family toxin n=1 Tax=Mesorhizobium ventifaucium TaxID=666020 RepID=UPI00345B6569